MLLVLREELWSIILFGRGVVVTYRAKRRQAIR